MKGTVKERNSIDSIPARFAAVARQHADRIAVSSDTARWSYAELDGRSNSLARKLVAGGRADSSPVALLMDHDAPLIASVLGCLKAGRLYLALDPSESRERLLSMLADAQAGHLVADAAHLAQAHSLGGERGRILEFSGAESDPAEIPGFPDPDCGAWLVYTSGSTGKPKGVWQNHAGILRQSEIYGDLIGVRASDRFSLLTSLNLGASSSALFTALLNGAALCPFNLRKRGLGPVPDWLHRHGVSVFHSVPTLFRHLMRAVDDAHCLESLRIVRLGGEAIHPADVKLFQERCPESCRLMLAFSSTETGLMCASILDHSSPVPDGPVSCGRPVEGIELELLEEGGEPVPEGEEGRIAVRSPHLRQGYWRDRAAAGDEGFDPDPDRFLTGDLGRILPDGSLLHGGRADQVVKIRGRRVDLGEVESALNSLGPVQESVAGASAKENGESQLVGYVVLRPGAAASAADLRRGLQHMPGHLLPSGFVFLDELPLTRSGKVDRRSLPRWSPDSTDTGEAGLLAPRKGIETSLAEIWQSVLDVPAVGRDSDFFDLGGDSLRSVQLLSRMEERYNVILLPSILVEHSTLESLARVVAGEAVQATSSPLVPIRKSESGRRPLFLVHSGEGTWRFTGSWRSDCRTGRSTVCRAWAWTASAHRCAASGKSPVVMSRK